MLSQQNADRQEQVQKGIVQVIFQEYNEKPEEVSIDNLTETMLNDLIINKIVMRKFIHCVTFLSPADKRQSKEKFITAKFKLDITCYYGIMHNRARKAFTKHQRS